MYVLYVHKILSLALAILVYVHKTLALATLVYVQETLALVTLVYIHKTLSRVKNSDSVTNLRLTKFDDFILYFRIFATK